MRPVLLALAALAACAPAPAVEAPAPPASATAPPTSATAPAAPDPAEALPARTEVEDAVETTISGPGVHVVHFWAPWCGNSRAEFEAGWYEVVEANPDVSFSFVAIWNDGRASEDRLARWGIVPADHVSIYAQPDLGPSADRTQRRRTFMGLPLTWTPTTWVFNRGGRLAYAFNYGEVSPDMLATAIEHARDEWMHE